MEETNKAVGLLIGSYASPDQPRLFMYSFDSCSGEPKFKAAVDGLTNPSFLCLNQDANRAFVVSEYKTGDYGRVTLYSVEETNPLILQNVVSYEGAGSCYITIDRADQHLFVANYATGSLVVLALMAGGHGAVPKQTIQFEGSGPVKDRQEQSHIHAAILSTNQSMLYCTDLGADRLYAFNYDPKADMPLQPADPAYVSLPAGCGPRHLILSPNGRWLYLLCELSGEIFVFEQGQLQNWKQCVSVVSTGFNGKIEAADLQMNAQGTCLYATNRGDANQVVVFAVDDDGKLDRIQQVSSQGESPRSISLDPTGHFLLVANEKGNCVTVFVVSPLDGKLIYTGQRVELNSPTCVKFAR